MAPFIGRRGSDCKETVRFSKCEIPNCALDIEFQLTELEGGAVAEDSGDEEFKDAKGAEENSDGKTHNDEVKALQQKMVEMKKELQEVRMGKESVEQQLQIKEERITVLTQDREQAVKKLEELQQLNSGNDEHQN